MKVHSHVFLTQLVLLNGGPFSSFSLVLRVKNMAHIRNRPIPIPLIPGRFSVSLDLPAIAEQRGTSGIVLDAAHSLLKLPGLAIRREHIGIEQCQDSTLVAMPSANCHNRLSFRENPQS